MSKREKVAYGTGAVSAATLGALMSKTGGYHYNPLSNKLPHKLMKHTGNPLAALGVAGLGIGLLQTRARVKGDKARRNS